MESIVFFGKGGIGKSTIASNVTVIMSMRGRKVLHVGCDPKMDSTLSLMRGHIQPFSANSGSHGQCDLRNSIHASAVKGVYCIEAGGPQAGVGCAGAGIGAMLDAMKESSLLEKDGYDAAVFDVLGDVVCGGFAAPLRRGFAKKIVIVTSEELLSLYAANRLIMMVNNYSRNGVYLAGLVVNARNSGGAALVENFAAAVNTRVLGVILRDAVVEKAERKHRSAALEYPQSDFARRVVRLTAAIRSASAPQTSPCSLSDADFFAFTEGLLAPGKPRNVPRAGCRAIAPVRGGKTPGSRPVAALLEAAGFKAAGIEDGQIICDWTFSCGTYRVVIASSASAAEGLMRFSDWTVCFHPSAGKVSDVASSGLGVAAARLAALRFHEMLFAFTGASDYYGGISSGIRPGNSELKAPDTPSRPHIAFGQWHRFIFPQGTVSACVPPGSVMVEHGDSECRFSGCACGAIGMFSANSVPAPSGARGPLLPRDDEQIVNTDFNARDAVLGDEVKMLSSLYGAARKAGRGGLVEFYVGCSPMMLAGDAVFAAAKVERETGVRVVLENYNSFGEYAPAKAAVRIDFMASRLSGGKVKKTYDVNIASFRGAGLKLSAILADSGISAADPEEDFYARARSARLQVLPAPDSVLGPAFDKAGMKWLLPPAPWGFTGTEAWLTAISRALGRKRAVTGPSPKQIMEAAGLRSRARSFRAGFVLAAEEINMLSGNTALKSVPVLPVLAEAGFGLKLFVIGEGRSKSVVRDIAELKAAVPDRGLSVKFFRTMAELNTLLRSDSTLKLVYSDIRNDPRVVAAGRTPFSLELLEPGYEGALESCRRLLELCEWDFNEHYLSTK